jgi:hypothetical protein
MKSLYGFACLMLGLAIVCDVVSKPIAQAVLVSVAEKGQVTAGGVFQTPADASRLLTISDGFCWAGVALAGAGVVAWLFSFGRPRRGPAIVPILFVVIYAILYVFVT